MSLLALVLIIISAFMHATWNFLAKLSNSGFSFVWLYLISSAIIYAPLVAGLFIFTDVQFGWMEAAFIIGSAGIHLTYSLTLQKGYTVGDLSLIYPLARGTGPMLVAIIAFFFLDEPLTIVSSVGIIFIIGSVFVISGGLQSLRNMKDTTAVSYGLLIGVMIASYTLVDKLAVSTFVIPPILLIYGFIIGQIILLTPKAIKNWSDVKSDWHKHRNKAIGVGILNPLAYILVLVAMTFTPVSHVAAVREMSILIGTIMGTKMLSEGFGSRRMIAAGTMIIGIILVTMSDI
ncbi:EamA family transporter [Ornithinibacillus gellani]|uniref:EamA family transporter n=1 Tax=Ornithinibacillus gellani TaxID=2293253 RepID=UPI000F49E23A|nr:EamA family transporter [Ornithinibacillus gellani]TQS74161.1 EamA family transporter [Ornithinibacillus gellani]